MQPTKRPTGMINSRFIENVYTASDKEPKTKNKIRDHFDASCTRISNLSRSVCCAFLQGNSWTGIGIASLSFSFMIPICTLTSLGSLWSATDALIEGARVQNVWCGRYIPEHLQNWQGWHRDRLTCTKEQKILVQKNEHGDGIKFTKIQQFHPVSSYTIKLLELQLKWNPLHIQYG